MTCVLTLSAQVEPAVSAEVSPADSIVLLHRIQAASQHSNYTGVFTYQQGASMQSSRVTHIADGKDEHERLEMLDGQPLEFLRHNDEVQCLIPSKKTILVENRSTRDRFPGLMLGGPERLVEHYNVSIAAAQERVADRDCQVITLDPKDGNRYGYRLCADTASGLLLRAQTLAAPDSVVEQVAFITLQTGADVDPKQLKSRWTTDQWHVVRTDMVPTNLAAAGWTVGEPAGFQKITQVKRSMGGKPDVKQVMLSDGLAAISVFIEPFSSEHPQHIGAASRGAIHVVGKRVGDYWITVLGEAPLATIQEVADSIDYKPVSRHP